jgi:hypothetical protein
MVAAFLLVSSGLDILIYVFSSPISGNRYCNTVPSRNLNKNFLLFCNNQVARIQTWWLFECQWSKKTSRSNKMQVDRNQQQIATKMIIRRYKLSLLITSAIHFKICNFK